MRIVLIIGGVVFALVASISVWVLWPRAADPGTEPAPVEVAETAPAARAPSELSADAEEGDLRVCNQTPNPVSIALGYRTERGWQSEGWWVAQPRECQTIYQGQLDDSRYYYLYAADDIGGGSWDGSNYMCTRDETFTIFGVEDCLARGYERTGFFEIDTQGRSNWTLQLTDGDVRGADPADGTDDIPAEELGTGE